MNSNTFLVACHSKDRPPANSDIETVEKGGSRWCEVKMTINKHLTLCI